MPKSARTEREAPHPATPGAAARQKSIRCLSRFEREARERGFRRIAGIDEVGRGALFGPVFAGAVILDPEKDIRGLADSKILDAPDRARLAAQIKKRSIAWAVGTADAFEIDQVNIYQASRLAMKRAIESLPVAPDFLLIDAMRIDVPVHQESLIDGDARCRAIAAASIIAKVARDECMQQWHSIFSQYNLKDNKGYSTPDHKRALREHGPTMLHRFSFEPVRLCSPLSLWNGYQTDEVQQNLFSDDGDLQIDDVQ